MITILFGINSRTQVHKFYKKRYWNFVFKQQIFNHKSTIFLLMVYRYL